MPPGQTDSLRIAAFGSLAESARTNGNRLESSQIDELVRVVNEEPDLTMRTAASQEEGPLVMVLAGISSYEGMRNVTAGLEAEALHRNFALLLAELKVANGRRFLEPRVGPSPERGPSPRWLTQPRAAHCFRQSDEWVRREFVH